MALHGLDLSHWQATSAVDGAADFVILKATEGTTYVDPDCDNKYQRAKKQGKLRGVYHYASMGNPVSEADYFVNNTSGYWQNKDAILVLDFETHTDVQWALAFLNRVKDRTGVKPLIYMSASTIRAVDWSPVVKADYGLWVAGYPAKYNVANPPSTDGGDMPYNISPWKFAAIWQYTSSAGTLDRDVAFMSKEAWALYAGNKPVPAPAPVEPVPTPAPKQAPDPTPEPAPVPNPVPVPDPGTVVTPDPVPTPAPEVTPVVSPWYTKLIKAVLDFILKVWNYEVR